MKDVRVIHIPPRTVGPDALTDVERSFLARAAFTPRRADEWLRGRVAIRRTLVDLGHMVTIDVVANERGAPTVVGGAISVSLSHEEDDFAVVVGDHETNVGVDLCAVSHERRARRLLAHWCRGAEALPAIVRWACIESVVKMRKCSVTAMMDLKISCAVHGPRLAVYGLGPPALASWMCTPRFALAWSTERC